MMDIAPAKPLLPQEQLNLANRDKDKPGKPHKKHSRPGAHEKDAKKKARPSES